MPAPRHNTNATGKRRVKHTRQAVSISGPTLDLLHDALAMDGNINPSKQEIADAVYYAIRTVYGRRIEDQQAIIL